MDTEAIKSHTVKECDSHTCSVCHDKIYDNIHILNMYMVMLWFKVSCIIEEDYIM